MDLVNKLTLINLECVNVLMTVTKLCKLEEEKKRNPLTQFSFGW